MADSLPAVVERIVDALQPEKIILTHRRLKDRYLFEERGPIEIKGKGAMPVYLLIGHTGHTGRA